MKYNIMKYNIVINQKTGEKISLKEIIELNYSIAKIDSGLAILFEQKEEVLKLFEKYEEEDVSIYCVEDKILISFNKENFYYMLHEIPSKVSHFIKLDKLINFVFRHNNFDYLLKFDKIIQ